MSSPPTPVPDAWVVLEVERPQNEESAALLVEELMGIGGRGVEERGDTFLVYLPETGTSPEEFTDKLRANLSRFGDETPLAVTFRRQRHEDWEATWREGLHPRRVTSRLVVAPTWEDLELKPGELLISIDPGMAFGTAEHPTTRGCLRLLDGRVEPGDHVADIGAGSGILSIAAALLGSERVLAVESDPWSCATARENVDLNAVADRVEVFEAVVGPEFVPEQPPFDGIVANIESGVLLLLLEGFRSGLRDDGWLILSGILDSEAQEIVESASKGGFIRTDEDREDGWWTGAFRAVPSGEG